MIERCNHGDVKWDGIRENTTTAHAKAVGTCDDCGVTVASTLSSRHEVEHDDEDQEEVETKPVVEPGRA